MSVDILEFSSPEPAPDGSVWALCQRGTELVDARMVVDTDHPALPFLLPASAVWDLNATQPLGDNNSEHCPSWRWATAGDLANWRAQS